MNEWIYTIIYNLSQYVMQEYLRRNSSRKEGTYFWSLRVIITDICYGKFSCTPGSVIGSFLTV